MLDNTETPDILDAAITHLLRNKSLIERIVKTNSEIVDLIVPLAPYMHPEFRKILGAKLQHQTHQIDEMIEAFQNTQNDLAAFVNHHQKTIDEFLAYLKEHD